jgi:arylsulfatase A-like enzyme
MKYLSQSFCIFLLILPFLSGGQAGQKPNVILIYVDDLGFGDLSCYGSKTIKTPNIDRIAKKGLLFTRAHTTSATCTPSRYSLLTGVYAFRRKDTGIATGDASALIPAGQQTVATIFSQAGYHTAVIGKWHLGLGPVGGPNWNGKIEHGPLDIGFKEAFILPATGDRVPCVYIENDHVRNLDGQDPIEVNYLKKIGNQPTGKENPELLKMKHSHGHDNTIVNGVGRIGFMVGGKQALWDDEDMAQTLANKAKSFMVRNKKNPFFLYFATHDIHVPRIPNSRFLGKSGFGNRGDALLQLDDTVGQLMKTLDSLHLNSNTLIILTSDNGPVVDDGYIDGSKENLGLHQPAGILRGGKYSSFEAGTRVPFIVKWPKHVHVGHSNAMISQIDFLASMSQLLRKTFDGNSAKDSQANLNAWLGKDKIGRDYIIEQAGTLAIKKGDWKFIKSGKGAKFNALVNIELGNDSEEQLYNLKSDPKEKINLAADHKEKIVDLKSLLEQEMNK